MMVLEVLQLQCYVSTTSRRTCIRQLTAFPMRLLRAGIMAEDSTYQLSVNAVTLLNTISTQHTPIKLCAYHAYLAVHGSIALATEKMHSGLYGMLSGILINLACGPLSHIAINTVSTICEMDQDGTGLMKCEKLKLFMPMPFELRKGIFTLSNAIMSPSNLLSTTISVDVG